MTTNDPARSLACMKVLSFSYVFSAAFKLLLSGGYEVKGFIKSSENAIKRESA